MSKSKILGYREYSMSEYYNDAILSAMAAQITSLMIVYSAVYSSADQRKDQSSASLVFVSGIYRWPVNSPHKGPVTRKMFPFDDGIMTELGYSDLSVLKLINDDFQIWYLIGWQRGPQAIRGHVRKPALVNMDFNMDCLSNHGPWSIPCHEAYIIPPSL